MPEFDFIEDEVSDFEDADIFDFQPEEEVLKPQFPRLQPGATLGDVLRQPTPIIAPWEGGVVRSVFPGSLQPEDLVPAVRKIGGELAVGEPGDTHPDIIKSEDIPAVEIDQRGFLGPEGFMDREAAAQALGFKADTEFEPGRLHSTDLAKAQEEPEETPTKTLADFIKEPSTVIKTPEEQIEDLRQMADVAWNKAHPFPTEEEILAHQKEIGAVPTPLLSLPRAPKIEEEPRSLLEHFETGPTQALFGEKAADIQAQITRSVYNAAVTIPEFFTTEEGAIAFLAGATPVGAALVTGYFAYDTAKNLIEQAKKMGGDWDSMSPLEKARSLTEAAATLGLSTLLAKHLVKKGMEVAPKRIEAAKVTAPVEAARPVVAEAKVAPEQIATDLGGTVGYPVKGKAYYRFPTEEYGTINVIVDRDAPIDVVRSKLQTSIDRFKAVEEPAPKPEVPAVETEAGLREAVTPEGTTPVDLAIAGGKPKPAEVTAMDLLRMTPEQIVEWKKSGEYGEAKRLAMSKAVDTKDIPALEAERDRLRKEATDTLDAVEGKSPEERMQAAQSVGQIALKAQLLNEMLMDAPKPASVKGGPSRALPAEAQAKEAAAKAEQRRIAEEFKAKLEAEAKAKAEAAKATAPEEAPLISGRTAVAEGFSGKPIAEQAIWNWLSRKHDITPGGSVEVIDTFGPDRTNVPAELIYRNNADGTKTPVGIRLNRSAIYNEMVLNEFYEHELSHWADLETKGLAEDVLSQSTESERADIDRRVRELAYSQSERDYEFAARAIQDMAKKWRGRGWFERAVLTVQSFLTDTVGIKASEKVLRAKAERIAVRAIARASERVRGAEPYRATTETAASVEESETPAPVGSLRMLTPKYREKMRDAIARGDPKAEDYRKALSIQDQLDRNKLFWRLNPEKSWMEDNVEYWKSVDPDLLCQRSEGTDAAVNYLKQTLGDKYSSDLAWEVVARANERGLQSPCPQCYVYSARAKPGGAMQKKYVIGVGGYSGDISRLSESNLEQIARRGLRHYSSTDFKAEHIPGLIAEVLDASDRRLPMAGYSKQGDLARIFGDSGMHINLSVGRDASVGMNMAEAIALRKKYPNVSTIYVSFTDAETISALKNPNIDHVIPWHGSGQALDELKAKLNDPNIIDYTKFQNETIDGKKAERQIKEWEHGGDLRKYLALVKQNGLTKKFPQIYDSLKAEGREDLYMKLIGPEYGKHGGAYPYEPVKAKFNYAAVEPAMKGRLKTRLASSKEFIGIAKQIASEVRKGTFERGETEPDIKTGPMRQTSGKAGTIGKLEGRAAKPEVTIGEGIEAALKRKGEAGAVSVPKGVTEAVQKSADYVKSLADEELKAPKMTDRRRAVLNWSAKLQRSFNEASQKQQAILRAVPSRVRREGITNWIQADGDAQVLRQRANATTDPNLKAGYEAALTLTPEEIAIANQVKADYAAFAARGQAADVLGQLKDNYVTQSWNLGKGPGGMGVGRTLKEKFRFSKASTFANFFEGEQAGYTPKTKDIAKLLPMYSHEMNSVIAAREMVAEMGKGVASDGRPLLAPRGIGVPIEDPITGEKSTLVMPKVGKEETSDYKVLPNQPALSGWRWASKDSAGNPVFLKADLALHPEAFKHLRSVLGRSAIREWYGERTTALGEIPKAIVRGIDFANSETKRTMLGLLATFHQIQTGTHAVGHRVNPLFNIPKVDLVNNPLQMDAAKHGLMMAPDRASMDQFMEGFRTSGLISRIPGIGPLADWYGHYLFHDYIPGLKFKTYDAILNRNLKVYAKPISAGKVTPADVKILSAEQANAAYGHINYADLGRNPTMQHIAQLGLLAPDFLEARGRFAGQAIKGLTGAKVGREQLLALATLAIAQAAGAYIFAKGTDGEWDPKRPFEFVKGNRRYTLRSVPEDVQNLLTKTRQFVHSRLSPLVGKGTLQYLTGVDYRGQRVSALETTKELAAQPIPLTIRGFTGLGRSTLTAMEQLAGSLGLRISRYSPSMDVYDMVRDFKKSSDDPKLQSQVELQEKEVFSSVYDKLRTALHNQDMAGAREEYDKLTKIRTPKQINDALKPWTGGNLNRETLTMSPRKPKPFTGSAATERKFIASLTADQREAYKRAMAERLHFYTSFRDMLKQTAPKP